MDARYSKVQLIIPFGSCGGWLGVTGGVGKPFHWLAWGHWWSGKAIPLVDLGSLVEWESHSIGWLGVTGGVRKPFHWLTWGHWRSGKAIPLVGLGSLAERENHFIGCGLGSLVEWKSHSNGIRMLQSIAKSQPLSCGDYDCSIVHLHRVRHPPPHTPDCSIVHLHRIRHPPPHTPVPTAFVTCTKCDPWFDPLSSNCSRSISLSALCSDARMHLGGCMCLGVISTVV